MFNKSVLSFEYAKYKYRNDYIYIYIYPPEKGFNMATSIDTPS